MCLQYLTIRFLFFALSSAFALSSTIDAKASTYEKESGKTHRINEAIVAVKAQGIKGFCSGVLISPTEILTATHCIYNMQKQSYVAPQNIKIGFGNNLLDEGFDWQPIRKIEKTDQAVFRAPNDFLNKDISRLILDKPINSIQPITYAADHSQNAELFAWGFGEDAFGYYGIKKSRKLTNVSITQNQIRFTSGACRGDSGGPIVNKQNQLIGIVSLSRVRHCVEAGERIAQRVKFSY